MELLYATIALYVLLAFPGMSKSRPDDVRSYEEGIRARRSVKTEIRKESSWFINKRSQLEKVTKQPGKKGAKTLSPRCDETCTYVTKLLRTADFFVAAYCTFTTVTTQQGKDIGEKQTKIAREISENALLHYSDLASEIAIEEPRIKIENEIEIKNTCEHAEVMSCNAVERHPYASFYELKCTKQCRGSSLCIKLLGELFELAHKDYGIKYDELAGENEEEDDDYDYPFLP